MSDAAPVFRDLLSNGADEELIFDEPVAADAITPVAPGPEAGTPTPRRTPRRGRKTVDETPSSDFAPTDPPPSRSAKAGPAAADEPAGAPAPFPPSGAGPAGSRPQTWLLAIVTFAMLTSLVSLGGLIAVGRTLARTDIDREQVAAERAALVGVPTLMARLDAASPRLDSPTAALRAGAAVATGPAGPAITMADLHHELDALKLALSQRQPEGLTPLNDMTRDGFTEVMTKLDRLSAQLDQISQRGAVSASRPASHAGDRGRPS